MYTFGTNRNSLTNEKKYSRYHGSILGGILSIFCLMGTAGYLVNEIGRMTQGSYDNYNTQLKSNPLTDIYKEQQINKTDFFPVMEIVNLNFAPDLSGLTNEFDIFEKGGGFDLGKLFTYFDIKIHGNTHHMNSHGITTGHCKVCKEY